MSASHPVSPRFSFSLLLTIGMLVLGDLTGMCRADDLASSSALNRSGEAKMGYTETGRVKMPLTDSSHRSMIFRELRDDLHFMIDDRTFYAVTIPLLVTPLLAEDLLEQEPQTLRHGWSHSATANVLFETGETLGNGLVPIGASVALYGTGRLAHAPGLSALASDLLRAHGINALLTHAIKRTVNRARPDGSPYSFPSGHTSSAFTAAGVIAHAVGFRWGLVARGGALVVALSRVQENEHYISDVVAGAILGTYVASTVVRRQHRTRALSWAPWTDGRRAGVLLLLSLP